MERRKRRHSAATSPKPLAKKGVVDKTANAEFVDEDGITFNVLSSSNRPTIMLKCQTNQSKLTLRPNQTMHHMAPDSDISTDSESSTQSDSDLKKGQTPSRGCSYERKNKRSSHSRSSRALEKMVPRLQNLLASHELKSWSWGGAGPERRDQGHRPIPHQILIDTKDIIIRKTIAGTSLIGTGIILPLGVDLGKQLKLTSLLTQVGKLSHWLKYLRLFNFHPIPPSIPRQWQMKGLILIHQGL